MLRLSRQSWNNLIIFGVLALFFLFYIAPNHLAMMRSQNTVVTVVQPGQRILQLEFPRAALKQAGPVWRLEPAVSGLDANTILNTWQDLQLAVPLQNNSLILAQVCRVLLSQSGEAAPVTWQIVLDQQQWYLQQQQFLFPIDQATADLLCPPSLR